MNNFKLIKMLVVALAALASIGCGSSSSFDAYEAKTITFKPNAATSAVGSPDLALTFEAVLWDGSTYVGSLADLLANGYSLGYFNYTLEGEDGSPATNSVLDSNTGIIKIGNTPGVYKVHLVADGETLIDTFTLTVVPAEDEPEKTITAAFFHGASADSPEAPEQQLVINESFALTFDVTYSDGSSAQSVSYKEIINAGYKVVAHLNDATTPNFNAVTGVITLEEGQSFDFFELYRADVTPGHATGDRETVQDDSPMWLSGVMVGELER